MSHAPLTLTNHDEYLCHQAVASLEQPISTDRNWTEKGYIVAFDASGEVMVAMGIGKYPNRNVLDGFAIVSIAGSQYNVRASRELRPEFDRTAVGPVSWEIIEPPMRNRLRLGENDLDIAFDIEFEGLFPPVAETGGSTRINGVTVNDTIRYFQHARAGGVVTVEGREYRIDKDRSYSYKDRSWGVRVMTGVPYEGAFFFGDPSAQGESGLYSPVPAMPGIFSGVFAFRFETWSIFSAFGQTPDGTMIGSGGGGSGGYLVYPTNDPRAPVHAQVAEMDWEFVPGTRRARSARVVFELEDGSKREVTTSPLDRVLYFRGGGYFGFRGWWQGKHMGPLAVGGEKMSLTDKADLDELYGCEEIAVRCTCGDEHGYGVLEPFAVGALPRYGIEAHHLG